MAGQDISAEPADDVYSAYDAFRIYAEEDMVEAWKNAPFDLPAQKLTPMIFNHGYAG